ncbi:helix-turn-helix domain-containing protein [Chitinophaga sp. SYP-B3965]|uniref:helix-turn-helix domain-containing protein n=1 Tax=Chitinophaga sp. SYP-B3965 TaxID=2663120 RepID=UPI001299D161|nr:AraC family transcriptional regulator [Chitinophaga sp. SYP-B3965]MRG47332.1 helix-turn-helix domain-containing protein [Chitinophaga sp. SYP-B3965]
MINVYEAILADPTYFKQLTVRDGLLVNYQCPQMEEWVDLYSHLNHIIYTVGGKKQLAGSGKSYLLTEGKLIFLKKGAMRQGKFFNVDWRTIVFCVPDSYLQQLFKEYRAQSVLPLLPFQETDPVIEISTNNITHAYFYGLLPYFTQQPPPSESLLELKCRELVFNMFSHPENTAFLAYLKSVSDYSKPPLTEIMEANYLFNLSLEEFAKISQRSLTVFKKDFAETFHNTPGKWLLQKRLDYAQLLLTSSQKNINEIVYECGFESTTHFSRVFKEKFGMAPLQYRKQLTSAE